MAMKPLHELNPVTRFSDRAVDYAAWRPDYPDAAIAFILRDLGDPRRLVVVDVGAGTGISSRRMAAHGVPVKAAEPNPEMRAAAAAHPLVEFVDARAEALPFADASVDLITCFQAFHWFRPEAALPEFGRILRPKGRVAVIWNERDHSDGFTGEYGELVRRLSNDHPAERREQSIEALQNSPLFTETRHGTFRCEQRLSLQGLIGRARSASYLPAGGEGLEQLIRELSEIHQRWHDQNGEVVLIHRTEVYISARR